MIEDQDSQFYALRQGLLVRHVLYKPGKDCMPDLRWCRTGMAITRKPWVHAKTLTLIEQALQHEAKSTYNLTNLNTGLLTPRWPQRLNWCLVTVGATIVRSLVIRVRQVPAIASITWSASLLAAYAKKRGRPDFTVCGAHWISGGHTKLVYAFDWYWPV